jgi:hypothetical protein
MEFGQNWLIICPILDTVISGAEATCSYKYLKLNSVVLVRKRTIPTERPQPVGEGSANFS